MGCSSERENLEDARAEQKWSYITLRDFTTSSSYSKLSYGILYVFLFISVAVYAVDIFTAVNLLFFNRWSGQVKPVISFKIARWIFAACILSSLVLLVYRWIRALRVIKSGVVAASYLDPLAVRIQSIRPGARGQGYRRFLVFAALTEGRKGAEYVALFTYFSFEAWMRIIFAQGPRQLLNAQTLYSVMRADLLPAGDHAAKDGHSPIAQFFINVRILADHNKEQAAILFGMLFTLIIWLISVLSLLLACIFYLVFLWRHIPVSDGTLSRYCRRKIDSRLSKIVSAKVDKALARGERLRAEAAAKAFTGDRPAQVERQPTLPSVHEDSDFVRPSNLSHRTTQDTFSSGPSRQESGRVTVHSQPTIPVVSPMDERPEAPSRSTTQSSSWSHESYGSDAPLMATAGEMGYAPPVRSFSRPIPSRSVSDRSMPYNHPSTTRTSSAASRSTQQSYNTAHTSRQPPGRLMSNGTSRDLTRQNTDTTTYSPAMDILNHEAINSRPPTRQGRQTPALVIPHSRTPPVQAFEMHPQPPPNRPSRGASIYVAYNPNIHNPPPQTSSSARNFTSPTLPRPPMNDYFPPQPSSIPRRADTAPPLPPLPVLQVVRPGTAAPLLPPLPTMQKRPGTAPIPHFDPAPLHHHSSVQQQGTSIMPIRSATAGPEERQLQRKPVYQQPHF
ncbi:MAG: hypothetical protein Q9224_003170 [Gallowayella concinna]